MSSAKILEGGILQGGARQFPRGAFDIEVDVYIYMCVLLHVVAWQQ